MIYFNKKTYSTILLTGTLILVLFLLTPPVMASNSCAGLFKTPLALAPYDLSMTPSKKISQTIEHKYRLKVAGLIIFDHYPQFFESLSRELVREYLNLHDLPKIMALSQLKKYGYTHTETINVRLFKFEGRPKSGLSREEKQVLQEIIDDLNRVEEIIKNHFFENHEISEGQIKQLQRLERITDKVDTGLFRSDEIAGRNGVFPGSSYLRAESFSKDDIQIAKWLESNKHLIFSYGINRTFPKPPNYDTNPSDFMRWVQRVVMIGLLSAAISSSDPVDSKNPNQHSNQPITIEQSIDL